VIYWLLKLFHFVLWRFSLRNVARLGRCLGELAYWVDRRHRRRTLENLRYVFAGEGDRGRQAALAREHFRRLGENYCCAVRAAGMTLDQLKPHVEVTISAPLWDEKSDRENVLMVIGHFGNFELYAHAGHWLGASMIATTYRALKHPGANRALEEWRRFSRIRYYERCGELTQLKRELGRPQKLVLGLLADQHTGKGVPTMFLDRECLSSAAPALLALRYRLKLRTAICYRVGLARWRIEIGKSIPTAACSGPRSVPDITQEIQDVLGSAVRRDPANWLWAHRRWRRSGRAS